MKQTTNVHQCRRVALVGLLMAGTVCLFETGACGLVSQCVKHMIQYQDCYVDLKTSGSTVIVTPSDVALISGTKLSWHRSDPAPAKPDFRVDFDSDDCTPFAGVFHFDQSSSAATADQLGPDQFERCKYKVTIDGKTVDPHVIIIGGSRHQHPPATPSDRR
jgi:hypothetical protein